MLWGGRWEGGSCLGTHVRIKDFKIKKKIRGEIEDLTILKKLEKKQKKKKGMILKILKISGPFWCNGLCGMTPKVVPSV